MDIPKVAMTEETIDCRQPRYPRNVSEDRRFCDPALRQVCLCQRSAERPRPAHASWTDTVRMLCAVPPSRRRRRPVRSERSIDTHTKGTRANLSHIADITRRARLCPARNLNPFSDVRTKSRGHFSDLCHVRLASRLRMRRSRRTHVVSARRRSSGDGCPRCEHARTHGAIRLIAPYSPEKIAAPGTQAGSIETSALAWMAVKKKRQDYPPLSK